MATINYNGLYLEVVTTPQIFDPPKKCVVFDSYDERKSIIRNVVAVLKDGRIVAIGHFLFDKFLDYGQPPFVNDGKEK